MAFGAYSGGATQAPSNGVIISGNVGIGIANPGYKLSVDGSVGISRMSPYQIETGFIDYATAVQGLRLGTISANDSVSLWTNGADRLHITNAGNIGIGTTNPLAKLDVIGDIYAGGQVRVTNPDRSFNGALLRADTTHTSIYGGGNGATPAIGIDNNGNVGIGTTSPQAKLEVNGTALMDSGLTVNGGDLSFGTGSNINMNPGSEFRASGYGNFYITNPTIRWPGGTNDVGLSRYSTGVLAVGNGTTGSYTGTLIAGSIGIGTTTPAQALQVMGNIQMGNFGTNNNLVVPTNNTYGYLGGSSNVAQTGNDTTGWEFRTTSSANRNLYLYNTGSGTMGLSVQGNVGIGTSSPSQLLTVGNNNQFTVSSGGQLSVSGTSNDGNNLAAITQSGTGRALYVTRNTNANRALVSILQQSASGGTQAALDIQQAVATSVALGINSNGNGVNGDYNFVVLGNGSVGIGTTGPGYALDVVGSINASSVVQAQGGSVKMGQYNSLYGLYTGSSNMGFSTYDGSAIQTRITVLANNGNVGIGTTSPQSTLDVYGPIYVRNKMALDGDGQSTYLKAPAGGAIYLQPNGGSTALTVLSGGNVGIGTTSPNQLFTVGNNNQFTVSSGGSVNIATNLNVNGANLNSSSGYANVYQASGVQLSYWNGSSVVAGLLLNNTGNVGIGTTSPGAKLTLDSGSFLMTNAGGNSIELKHTNNYGVKMILDAANADLNFQTNNLGTYANVMTIQRSSGNVGIGTTTPSAPLDVYNSNSSSPTLNLTAPNATNAPWLRFTTVGLDVADIQNSNGFKFVSQLSGNDNQFVTNNGNFRVLNGSTEYFRVANGGNVGIGTTNPTHPLEVTTNLSNLWQPVAGFYAPNNTTSGNASQMRFGVSNTAGNSAEWRFVYQGSNNAANRTDFGWNGYANPVISYNVAGNVGIGTVNPGNTLDIKSGMAGLSIQSTSTTQAYQVFVTPTGSTLVGQAGTAGNLVSNSAAGDYVVSNRSGGGIILSADTSFTRNDLKITSAGNVGIGTTGPVSLFAVQGSNPVMTLYNSSLAKQTWQLRNGVAGTAAFDLYDANNKVTLLSAFSGEVMIATSSDPTNTNAKLFVAGSASSGANITAMGTASFGNDQASLNLVGSDYAANYDGLQLYYYGPNSIGTTMGLTNINSGQIAFNGANNALIYTSTTSPLVFGTNFSERMRITGDGNIGIGTTTPATELEVKHKGTGNGGLRISSDQNAGYLQLGGDLPYIETAPGYTLFFNWANSGNPINFKGNAMYIAANNNIGIGTTTPGYKLDVQGGYVNASSGLCINGDCKTSWASVGSGLPSGSTGQTLYYNGSSWAATSNLYNNGTNVGIGTTNPSYKLDVAGSINSSNSITAAGVAMGNNVGLWFSGSTNYAGIYDYQPSSAHGLGFTTMGTGRMFIDNNGNVGIGTTGPGYPLQVVAPSGGTGVRVADFSSNGSVSSYITVSDTGTGTPVGAFAAYPGAMPSIRIESLTNHRFDIGTNDTIRMSVDTSGNVGIGTSNPQQKLDVSGAIALNGQAFGSNSSGYNYLWSDTTGLNITNKAGNTNLVTILNSGNVGIGTTNPGYLLDVNGSVHASTTLTSGALGTYGAINLLSAATGNQRFRVDQNNDYGQLRLYDSSNNTIISLGGNNNNYINSGNVGIGTTNPSAVLDIVGNINLSGTSNRVVRASDTTGARDLTLRGSPGVGTGLDLAGSAILQGGNTNSAIVTAGGGYGGTGNGGNLTLYAGGTGGTNGTPGYVEIKGGASGQNNPAGDVLITGGYGSWGGTAHGGNVYIDGGGDGGKGPGNIFLGSSRGNVGIGTTTPAIVSVAGRKYLTIQGSTDSGVLELATGGGSANGTQVGQIQFTNVASTTPYRTAGIVSTIDGSSASPGGALQFFTTVDNGGASQYLEKMRISNNGNIGIGTANPSVQLDVGGWSGKPSDLYSGFTGNVAGELYVGITGSGTGRTWLTSNANQGLLTWNSYWNGSVSKAMDTTKPSYSVQLNGGGGYPDTFQILRATTTSGSQAFVPLMTISGSGNAGFGTANPGIQPLLGYGRTYLTVKGASDMGVLELAQGAADADQVGVGMIQFTDINSTNSDKRAALIVGSLQGGTATNRGGQIKFYTKADNGVLSQQVTINNTGNVGIGTTTPAFKLDTYYNQSGAGAIHVKNAYSTGYTDASFRAENDLGYMALFGKEASGATAYKILAGNDAYVYNQTAGNLDIFNDAASGKILFAAGGSSTAHMTVDSTGNVGIGTTNPGGMLDVNNGAILHNASTLTTSIDNLQLGAMSFDTNAGQVSWADMPVTSSASTGTMESYTAQVGGTNILTVYAESNGSGGIQNPRVGIGLTNPSYQLQLSTDSAAKPTSNTWTIASDARLKTDITPFGDGLSVLTQINPVNYVLNGKGNMPLGAKGIGVIAQDVKDIIPYTISTFKAKLNPTDAQETELYSFNSSALTFVTINAIKELNASTTQLSGLINNINATLTPLTALGPLTGKVASLNSISQALSVDNGNVGIGSLTDESAARYRDLDGQLAAGDVVSLVSTTTVVSFGPGITGPDKVTGVIKAVGADSIRPQDGKIISSPIQPTTPILGVVSTKPGLMLNNNLPSSAPVTTSGSAPVKVSLENGNIKSGDYLSVSKLYPGYVAKAVYSGYVLGQAMQDTDASLSATSTSIITAFIRPGFQNVNNTFVLGNDGGQISGNVGVGVPTSTLDTSFIINQKGSGNILQLQQNDQDRLLIANDGSVNILANVSCNVGADTIRPTDGGKIISSPTGCPVLSVNNGTTTLFAINSVGDVTTTGHIKVGKDTAGVAIVKAGSTTVAVNFETPYDTAPVIVAAPYNFAQFRVTGRTATGFIIELKEAAAQDVNFGWFALEQPEAAAESSAMLPVQSAPSVAAPAATGTPVAAPAPDTSAAPPQDTASTTPAV